MKKGPRGILKKSKKDLIQAMCESGEDNDKKMWAERTALFNTSSEEKRGRVNRKI